MKLIAKCFAIALGTGAYAAAVAGSSTSVKITQVTIDTLAGTQLIVTVSANKVGSPSCSTANPTQYALVLGDIASDALFRLILQARSNNAMVTVEGSGVCAPNSAMETLKSITY